MYNDHSAVIWNHEEKIDLSCFLHCTENKKVMEQFVENLSCFGVYESLEFLMRFSWMVAWITLSILIYSFSCEVFKLQRRTSSLYVSLWSAILFDNSSFSGWTHFTFDLN